MIKSLLFIGEPITFKKICRVFPPTIKQVLGNTAFPQYKKILTFSEEDIKEEMSSLLKPGEPIPSPLEFLLINAYHNKTFSHIATLAFEFFTHETPKFDYENKQIIFQEDNSELLRLLQQNNFFEFQNLIRQVCGEAAIPPPLPEDPNEDPRIRRIKEKARMRDRIKAKKGVQGEGISLHSLLVSICCMGIGITPLNIGEMSYASLNMLLPTYQSKEKYELDIKALLAGADSKKIKPKYWIRNTD